MLGPERPCVITSYSIHYTKLYELENLNIKLLQIYWQKRTPYYLSKHLYLLLIVLQYSQILKVFVITSYSIHYTKLYDITVIELSGVKPNPRLSLVQQGIKLCKEHGIGFILAVGGGSVIDSAKAIALGALYSGDVWDFYLNINSPIESLPVGVVLTIPAAGSA